MHTKPYKNPSRVVATFSALRGIPSTTGPGGRRPPVPTDGNGMARSSARGHLSNCTPRPAPSEVVALELPDVDALVDSHLGHRAVGDEQVCVRHGADGQEVFV